RGSHRAAGDRAARRERRPGVPDEFARGRVRLSLHALAPAADGHGLGVQALAENSARPQDLSAPAEPVGEHGRGWDTLVGVLAGAVRPGADALAPERDRRL